MNLPPTDADMLRVEKAVQELSEHFESVQIFVTRSGEGPGDKATLNISYGSGNWFARLGQVMAWITSEKYFLPREKDASSMPD